MDPDNDRQHAALNERITKLAIELAMTQQILALLMGLLIVGIAAVFIGLLTGVFG